MVRVTIFLAIAAIAAASNGGRAIAAPERESRSLAVAYGDLDPTRESGARVLLSRLKSAAQQVCGPAPDIRDLMMRRGYDSCFDEAVGRAVNDLHFPLLAKVYGKSAIPSDAEMIASSGR